MSYDIEEKQRRLLRVKGSDVGIQAIIGGEFEVAWKRVQRCPLCGGKVIKSTGGEWLSPHRLQADKDGAYGSPHRHSYRKKP